MAGVSLIPLFSNALLVNGSSVMVRESELSADGAALENSGTAQVINTQLTGGSSGSGTTRCIGSFGGQLNPLDGNCG